MSPLRVLDPSAGSGKMFAAMRQLERHFSLQEQVTYTGMDIDPDASYGRLAHSATTGDWLQLAPQLDRAGRRFDIGISNPPFGRAIGAETTAQHVFWLLELCAVATVVLPLPVVCSDTFDRVVWRRRPPARQVRVLDRPWPERLREAVVLEWFPHDGPTTIETLGRAPQ